MIVAWCVYIIPGECPENQCMLFFLMTLVPLVEKKKKTLFKMEVQTFIVLLLLFSEYRILQNTACLYLEPEHCLYHLKRGCGIIKALVGR